MSDEIKRKNPQTSIDAYRSLTIEELNDTYKRILSSLAALGEGTFEDIAAHAKLDKSRVWKRMSELERMELVYRPGTKKLLKSGRSGFTWSLTNSATPKTNKSEKELLKGTKPVHESAREILKVSQQSLFQNT